MFPLGKRFFTDHLRSSRRFLWAQEVTWEIGLWFILPSQITSSWPNEKTLNMCSFLRQLITSAAFNGNSNWPSSVCWHFGNKTSISVIVTTASSSPSSSAAALFIFTALSLVFSFNVQLKPASSHEMYQLTRLKVSSLSRQWGCQTLQTLQNTFHKTN